VSVGTGGKEPTGRSHLAVCMHAKDSHCVMQGFACQLITHNRLLPVLMVTLCQIIVLYWGSLSRCCCVCSYAACCLQYRQQPVVRNDTTVASKRREGLDCSKRQPD
jgi:hypothetical protein